MDKTKAMPEYIFESSWEVCNKVGGIYTALSTKARTLQHMLNDKIIFIGPDVWRENNAPDFIDDKNLFADWQQHAKTTEALSVKVGRWDVPGTPPVILVDFRPFFADKDALYYAMWNDFKVDSMQAYGDYDDSCIFAYAVGKVIESFYGFYKLENKQVAALFNEWMLGMGALYVKKHLPKVATLFTTHATSIGRSIAGNNKPLYAYMDGYNGDQMANELNMEAKHSVEKQAAHHVDCFTTVSDITACECCQLLEKEPHVTPNGFEPDFVPQGKDYKQKRSEARQVLINVAEKLCGCQIDKEALLIAISGRYEYRNKGIDVFIEAMNSLRLSNKLNTEIVAYIMVPGWVKEVRADLKEVVENNIQLTSPMQCPFITHWLNQMEHDKVLNYLYHAGFTNAETEKLKLVFVPCYLDGKDGIFNKSYYDLLVGMDATIFPSYYEPWGYTPLESIAFGIPTITTNLAGFGLWATKNTQVNHIDEGVVVTNRTDYNYFDVAEVITSSILELAQKNKRQVSGIQKKCFELAAKAEWKHFIVYHQEAFAIALANAAKRNC
ncbi:MAG: glycosyltransferase [Tannerellaceae bacterium]|nr:glycosyltransferase [Tannerellaceae bacterium]MCD8263805.1 glycosyltransferase [Tannerellaceae bacterium]